MPFRFGRERVNRYRFRKQYLASPAKTRDLPQIIDEIGPIRAVPASSAYLSLWARVAGFRHRHLDEAIVQKRVLASMRCMRGKLFLVPIAHLPVYYRLVRSEFRNGLSAVTDEIRSLVGRRVPESELVCEALEQRVLEILSSGGPATIEELDALLAPMCNGASVKGDDLRLGQRLIPAMEAHGLIIRAGRKGSWRSEQYQYAAMSSWLPGIALGGLTWEAAAERAILAYIRAFGPITLGDIIFWFGGIPRSQMAGLLLRLQHKLCHLEIQGCIGDYVMLREHMEEMGDMRLGSGNVALLPPHDSYLAAYGDTRRLLGRADRDRVLDRAGEPGGTIWRDGVVVGGWWAQPRQESIFLRFFEDVGADTIAMVGERARVMAHFLEYRTPSVDLGLYGGAALEQKDLLSAESTVPEPKDVRSEEVL